MGVGKSTIGKKLAKKLKLKFIDVDRIIEKRERNTIKMIFQNKGENYFRNIERKTTLALLKKKNAVIALGGGAFINRIIRKEVKKSSVSFWLDLNLDLLLRRLKYVSKRPLLNQKNLRQVINKIYSERKKTYNESNYRIKCDSIGIKKVINRIIDLYENTKN